MNMKKTALATAMVMGLGVAGAANADQVLSISITGGAFGMGAPTTLTACAGTAFSSHQCVTAGDSNPINTADGLFEGPTLTNFNFFNTPVHTFTAATAAGAANSTSGSPIDGQVSAGQIVLDLGSFYAEWGGTNFLQAPGDVNGALNPLVTGTYTPTDATHGTFDIAWSSYITTAPFATQTGYWELTGTATIAAAPPAPVPAPAAVWLFGAGMIGLMGLVRRGRKAEAAGSLSA